MRTLDDDRFLFQTDEEVAAAAELERRLKRDVHVGVDGSTFALRDDIRVDPRRRLLVDTPGGSDEVVVDGTAARHSIILAGTAGAGGVATKGRDGRVVVAGVEPLIIVAAGRTLRLINTKVVLPAGRSALGDHVLLGAGARIIASLDDNCQVVVADSDWEGGGAACGPRLSLPPAVKIRGNLGDNGADATEHPPPPLTHSTQIDLAAPGLEIIVVEGGERTQQQGVGGKGGGSGGGNLGNERGVLRATMGLALEYAAAGGSVTAKADVARLSLDLTSLQSLVSPSSSCSSRAAAAAARLPLLAPLDASARWSTSTR